MSLPFSLLLLVSTAFAEQPAHTQQVPAEPIMMMVTNDFTLVWEEEAPVIKVVLEDNARGIRRIEPIAGLKVGQEWHFPVHGGHRLSVYDVIVLYPDGSLEAKITALGPTITVGIDPSIAPKRHEADPSHFVNLNRVTDCDGEGCPATPSLR